jgi:nucleotide-binding universal stress UspA family protein
METILIPTDFSAAAEKAIRYVKDLAQRTPCRLVLLHTIYEPVLTESIPYGGVPYGGLPYAEPFRDPEYRQAQQHKLDDLKKSLQKKPWLMPTSFDTKIRYGETKDIISQVAHEEQADLIVLGTEGSAGLEEIVQGSVIAGVIKRAPCPVLIIPPKAVFRNIHKIVFATDLEGEPYGEVVFVSKLAGLFDAEILFLHVLDQDTPARHQKAQQDLERFKKRLAFRKASFHLQVNSHIEAGIQEFARHHKADLLVMAYHPRNFWQHLVAKDYTQKMAYHTTLPLLVIHYRE